MSNKNAVDFLKQYDTLQKSCQIIDEQMFEIMSLLRELKREENASTDTQNENVSRRFNKYLDGLTNECRVLSMRKRLLNYRIKMIENVVRSLPKNEQKVIERFFLSPDKHYAAEDLMEELEFEKTHIYRIRTRSLEMISKIIENIPLCEDSYDQT
ncbi:MAG: hypothetical protein E7648_07450 [Ruminococcaceae bacterium]|nr:hypothetical protein [Oscillospiraceae bacterium]